MQKTVTIPQFLGQLAIVIPGAVKAVEFTCHLPRFQVNMAISVMKPFYAKFRHVGVSTDFCLLAGFRTFCEQASMSVFPKIISRTKAFFLGISIRIVTFEQNVMQFSVGSFQVGCSIFIDRSGTAISIICEVRLHPAIAVNSSPCRRKALEFISDGAAQGEIDYLTGAIQ
jgi:hypothetical protein